MFNGKDNTQAVVDQFDEGGYAAYATNQYYVGSQQGDFGATKWYLASIGEWMELYGTDFTQITSFNNRAGSEGDNLKDHVNITLERLSQDGIAEIISGTYWSSSEAIGMTTWSLNTSTGTRAFSTKNISLNTRAFWSEENYFDPTDTNKPKAGDIMYLDKTWGSLDDYDSSKASQVAGVISSVGEDGSVTVVSLKDLAFDSSGNFNSANPYVGEKNSVKWCANELVKENIDDIVDVDIYGLVSAFNQNKGMNVEFVNIVSNTFDAGIYNEEFNKIVTQYDKLISDANYQGVNLLTGGELNIIFNETRMHDILIKGQDIRSEKIGLNKVNWNNANKVMETVKNIQNAIEKLRSLADDLGTNYQVIQTIQSFTDSLTEVLEEGADYLALADMNEASAEYLTLQTRQQLAVNSLSLASQSTSSILSLF